MSSTVVGALLGLGAQVYANAARKLPAMSSPWKHAVSAVVGAGVATWVVDYEEKTSQYVQESLSNRIAAEGSRVASAQK